MLYYNDMWACCERPNRSTSDRDCFTLAQAEECAWAWHVVFKHAERLAARRNAQLKVLYRRQEEEHIAEQESLAIENPELYATREFDRVHTINNGDCYSDCTNGCRGGTDCPHGWCEACASRSAAILHAQGVSYPIKVTFGYSPLRVATFTAKDVHSEVETVDQDDDY